MRDCAAAHLPPQHVVVIFSLSRQEYGCARPITLLAAFMLIGCFQIQASGQCKQVFRCFQLEDLQLGNAHNIPPRRMNGAICPREATARMFRSESSKQGAPYTH